MAPIGVQLVKYVLHLLNDTGRPTRGAGYLHRSRRGPGAGRPPQLDPRPAPDLVTPEDAMRFTRSAAVLAAAVLLAAGRPPRLWPPSCCPERNRGRRCRKDNGQRDVRRHQVLHLCTSSVMDCGRRGPALSSGPACPAHTALWTATAGGVRLADERSPARQACGGWAVPQGQAFAPGPDMAPSEPGWPGTIRSAGLGSALWLGPRLGPAGRPARPPSRRAHAESSAWRRGSASSPGQRPRREAGHGRSGLSWQALLHRRRR